MKGRLEKANSRGEKILGVYTEEAFHRAANKLLRDEKAIKKQQNKFVVKRHAAISKRAKK